MAIDRIMTDQSRGGTYREHVIKLQREFKQLIEDGAADPHTFEHLLCQLLQQFEQERLRNESQIRRLQNEMAYCEATNRACIMFANVLINTVAAVRHNMSPLTQPLKEPDPEIPQRVSDTDMLKQICICGCVDEEDAKNCSCVCHTQGFCDVPTCTYCQNIKKEHKNKPLKESKTKHTKTVAKHAKRGRKKKDLTN